MGMFSSISPVVAARLTTIHNSYKKAGIESFEVSMPISFPLQS